jgi:hypothetical protein
VVVCVVVVVVAVPGLRLIGMFLQVAAEQGVETRDNLIENIGG